MDEIDRIIKEAMIEQTKYLIIFENDCIEPIVLNIDDIDRSNYPDDDEIIKDYIEDNWSGNYYTAIRIDDLKSFTVK